MGARVPQEGGRVQGWESECWGCWGFPYMKIEKFVGFTKFPFHVFDKYEIHMQDFEELLRGSSSFPGTSFDIAIFQNCKNDKF